MQLLKRIACSDCTQRQPHEVNILVANTVNVVFNNMFNYIEMLKTYILLS